MSRARLSTYQKIARHADEARGLFDGDGNLVIGFDEVIRLRRFLEEVEKHRSRIDLYTASDWHDALMREPEG